MKLETLTDIKQALSFYADLAASTTLEIAALVLRKSDAKEALDGALLQALMMFNPADFPNEAARKKERERLTAESLEVNEAEKSLKEVERLLVLKNAEFESAKIKLNAALSISKLTSEKFNLDAAIKQASKS